MEVNFKKNNVESKETNEAIKEIERIIESEGIHTDDGLEHGVDKDDLKAIKTIYEEYKKLKQDNDNELMNIYINGVTDGKDRVKEIVNNTLYDLQKEKYVKELNNLDTLIEDSQIKILNKILGK